MPGPLDLLLPLGLLLGGGYVVKKVIAAPQLRPSIQPRYSLFPTAASQSGNVFSFEQQAPSSAATFFQSVISMFEPTGLKLSSKGADLIINAEGWRNTPYKDAAGYWTVGVGHKILPIDRIPIGTTITNARIQSLFENDVARAEDAVKRYVVVPLSQGQFDALVDFVFNLGAGNFASSTLLRKLNARDYAGAAAEFGRWVHAGNAVLQGLVARRTAEANLFNSGFA